MPSRQAVAWTSLLTLVPIRQCPSHLHNGLCHPALANSSRTTRPSMPMRVLLQAMPLQRLKLFAVVRTPLHRSHQVLGSSLRHTRHSTMLITWMTQLWIRQERLRMGPTQVNLRQPQEASVLKQVRVRIPTSEPIRPDSMGLMLLQKTKSTRTIGPFMEVQRQAWTRQLTWVKSIRTSSELCFVISLPKTQRISWTLRVLMMDLKLVRKTPKLKLKCFKKADLMQPKLWLTKPQKSQLLIRRIKRQELPSLTMQGTQRQTKWLSVIHLSTKIWTRPATISSLEASNHGID